MNQKAYVALISEGHFKVTCSHVRCKCCNVGKI